MGRTIFTGFNAGMSADDNECLVRLTGNTVSQRLLANTVSLGRDRIQWRNKCTVGRAYADLITHGGDS